MNKIKKIKKNCNSIYILLYNNIVINEFFCNLNSKDLVMYSYITKTRLINRPAIVCLSNLSGNKQLKSFQTNINMLTPKTKNYYPRIILNQ